LAKPGGIAYLLGLDPPLPARLVLGLRSMMRTVWRPAIGLLVVAATLVACEAPLVYDRSVYVERQVRYDAQAALDRPAARRPLEIEQPHDRMLAESTVFAGVDMERLDEVSGPDRHRTSPVEPGPGLGAGEGETVELSLSRVIRAAVANNLDLEIARVIPPIREMQVVEAEAIFDPIVFANATFQHLDRPQPANVINQNTVAVNSQIRNQAQFEAGIRKRIQLGGVVSVATGFDWTNDSTPTIILDPDPSFTSRVELTYQQPLLRDFGERVNTARIALARNAKLRDVLELRRRLSETLLEVESTYWQLVLARYEVAIREDLLRMTEDTRDELEARREVDANPVQLAQATSQVQARRAELVRARAQLRDVSDQLKRLLNAPDLPLMSETVILPTDYPEEVPVRTPLDAAVTTALKRRPEPMQALLDIDDAKIQEYVAKNQKLPRLDLTAEARVFGLDESIDQSYQRFADEDFFDWLVGLQFEYPLGNRQGEAAFRRTRMTRQAQQLRYRNVAQDVVLSVKQALRAVQSSYAELQLARASRRAAARNLEALRQRERSGDPLTPEFVLDLKLRTQQRLAEAELAEIRATVQYNIGRAQRDQAMGVLLDRHRVEWWWPAAGWLPPAEGVVPAAQQPEPLPWEQLYPGESGG
jgi:outer membrane protein TolC